jgi:hypothetical protein
MPEKVEEKYPETGRIYEELWKRLKCCMGIDEKIGMPSAQSAWKMIGFLEELHQKQGVQSAPRTLVR